jgi:DNA-binding response OmpR family regulator
MPKLTGIELVKKLHATRMALPFIMAVGRLPKEEFTRYPWLQPAATLLKPYTKSELLGTVKKVLRATVSARSPREILLAAGSSGSTPPISRGEQIAPLPNWQSQPSADGLRL